ncbi:MAG: tRNA(His) guanylyltransferase Thg1 family protein [Nanoarchaeota archaeon]
MTNDPLGDRIKHQYEDRTRYFLPRRSYSIIRCDGRAFHGLKLKKPFDNEFMKAMQCTAFDLCREIQGAKFAYVQSDEISVLVTDFDQITTEAWFDGNIQKIVSISAGIASIRFGRYFDVHQCVFDSRVFTIPDPTEVENYFIWRQQDANRNSIQMAARAVYSHKELNNKNTSDLQELLHQKGINWNDYATDEKRGSVVKKVNSTFDDRGSWIVDKDIPIFTQSRDYLRRMIPKYDSLPQT